MKKTALSNYEVRFNNQPIGYYAKNLCGLWVARFLFGKLSFTREALKLNDLREKVRNAIDEYYSQL